MLLRARGAMQNGVFVNGADEVTVDGFMARDYKANGFFFTNVNGYTMNHLIARQTGVYGLYAFNSIGGAILNSEAYYVNDGAFYIGQTPPQTKPMRTIVRNVDGWGSPLGFSATNMRYVTITKSRFYNNAIGLAPERPGLREVPARRGERDHRQRHLLEQLQLPPGQAAVRRRDEGVAALAPIGTGIIMLGGKGNRIENNRIYGNFLSGVTAVESILVTKTPEARTLERNVIQNNQFGLDGTDVNGVDIAYDGNGTNNCFSMAGVTSKFPADGSTFAGCAAARTPSASPRRTRWSAGSARTR